MPASASHLEKLLEEVRDELKKIDQKANILLATVSLLLGFLIGPLITGDRDPSDFANWFEWLFWVGTVSVVLGQAAFIRSIWPFIYRESVKPPQFFGDFSQYDSGKELFEALSGDDYDEERRNAEQIQRLSVAVSNKHQFLRRGILLIAFGYISVALTIALHSIVS